MLCLHMSTNVQEPAAVMPGIRPWFSDLHVRYLLVPVLVFMAQASDTGYLADFWHHLARGEYIAEYGKLLDHDIYTFTVAEQPFQDVNWLTQCVYAVLFALGGLALVQTINALTLAISLGLLVHLCRKRCGSLVLAMAVGLAVFLGLWHVLSIRPQSFSILLFVLFLLVLDASVRRPWLLVTLPLLEGLWANLHGAFPAGIMLLGCFGLAELLRAVQAHTWTPRLSALTFAFVGCLAATLANPYGWHIYEYVGLTSQRAGSRGIDEWLPPSFDQLIGIAFFLSLPVLAGILIVAWKKNRFVPELEEAILILCFLPLAAMSIRMVAWWLLVIGLPLSRALATLFLNARDADMPRTMGATMTTVVLLLIAVFSVPWLAAFNPLLAWKDRERVEHRLEAVHQYLATHVGKGRVFTRLEWGEYLGRRGHPNFPVFMDGRIEIYPDDVWQAYSQITQAYRSWQDDLKAYGVNVLVLDAVYHERLGLLDQVRQSNWREVFRVGEAIVFTR